MYKTGKKDINDWMEGYKVIISGGDITNNKSQNYKLNKEAKALCKKLSDYCMEGSSKSNQYVGNLFTSYLGSSDHLRNDATTTFSYVFVFHPIANAIEQLITVYLIILGILVVTLYGVNKMIRKMRELQISYEKIEKNVQDQ